MMSKGTFREGVHYFYVGRRPIFKWALLGKDAARIAGQIQDGTFNYLAWSPTGNRDAAPCRSARRRSGTSPHRKRQPLPGLSGSPRGT